MIEEREIEGLILQIERKKIKNMYLRVLPPNGTVKMTVPLSVSENVIRSFLISHKEWIQKAQLKFEKAEEFQEHQYESGEKHMLWGKTYELEVIPSQRKSRVLLKNDRIFLFVSINSTKEERERLMLVWYREQLKAAIPSVMERCVSIVGRTPNEWHIKNMRTKWGTCNVQKKRIWLNLQLAKKSPECLEYVIIHELVHLYVRNHNQEFKEYMDRFYPNWREVKKKLNFT